MILLELVLELFGQFLVEALAELGFRAAGNVLRSRLGRLVTSAVVGFLGGWGWAAYLASKGHEGIPRTLWVSLALAAGAAVAATALRSSAEDPETAYPGGFLPWRWSPHQWDALALLNVFVALGVVVGVS